jgi:hypothetical protein
VQGLGMGASGEPTTQAELLDAQQRDRLRAVYLRKHFAGGPTSPAGE